MNRVIICLFLLWISIFYPAGAGSSQNEARLTRFQYTQVRMGVSVRMVVYARDEATAMRACEAAFHRLTELEDIMSDYRPSSELMRLCAHAGGPPVKVSKELFFILQRAYALSERTGGAFDVTVGPLIRLWREARKSGKLPPEESFRQTRARIGWQKMKLDKKVRTVQLLVPEMRLDLGGIAKGYASDIALSTLKRHGITRALIEAGGDIRVGGPPPREKGWRIEIANAGPEEKSLVLSNASISSSGDTEQYVEIEGKRYSHIVDPQTGLGITSRIAVTVVARDGITSDSLSTALSVIGAQEGQALVRKVRGARAYIRQAQ